MTSKLIFDIESFGPSDMLSIPDPKDAIKALLSVQPMQSSACSVFTFPLNNNPFAKGLDLVSPIQEYKNFIYNMFHDREIERNIALICLRYLELTANGYMGETLKIHKDFPKIGSRFLLETDLDDKAVITIEKDIPVIDNVGMVDPNSQDAQDFIENYISLGFNV